MPSGGVLARMRDPRYQAVAGIWHLAFRTPPLDALSLPDSLISIECTSGPVLLAESRPVRTTVA